LALTAVNQIEFPLILSENGSFWADLNTL